MSRISKKKLKEIKKKLSLKPLERQGFLYLENFFLIFKKEIIEKIKAEPKPLVRVGVS